MPVPVISSGLFSLTCALLIMVAPRRFDHSISFVAMSLMLATLAIHFHWKRRTKHAAPAVGLDTFFLTGYCVVHFAIPMYVTLGLLEEHQVHWRYNSRAYFMEATIGCVLAVTGFSIGYVLTYQRQLLRNLAKLHTRKMFLLDDTHAACLSALGSATFLLFLARNAGSYLGGNYQGLADTPELELIMLFFAQLLLTASVAVVVVKWLHKSSRIGPVTYAVCIPYGLLLLSLMVHGDRGGVVQCGGPLFVIALTVIPMRLRAPVIALSFIAFLVLLGAVREARQSDHGERGVATIWDAALSIDAKEHIDSTIMNLGGSGLLVPIAVAYQQHNGMMGGSFTRDAALATIPFSRRALSALGITDKEQIRQSSVLLGILALGHNRSWGVGTTSASDYYLDLGWIGVFVGHIFVGFAAARVESLAFAFPNDQRGYAVAVACLGLFGIMGRYCATSMIMRHVVYTGILVYGVCWAVRLLRGDTMWAVAEIPHVRSQGRWATIPSDADGY